MKADCCLFWSFNNVLTFDREKLNDLCNFYRLICLIFRLMPRSFHRQRKQLLKILFLILRKNSQELRITSDIQIFVNRSLLCWNKSSIFILIELSIRNWSLTREPWLWKRARYTILASLETSMSSLIDRFFPSCSTDEQRLTACITSWFSHSLNRLWNTFQINETFEWTS